MRCKYENLVISDDDMLFDGEWYTQLSKTPSFEILTSKVRLPDGGRFWDHACYQSPENEHRILEPHEEDSHLYMSGGQSWVMKQRVFEKVKWGEEFDMAGGSNAMSNIKDYRSGKHNEDTDYALQCREEGFKINHNPKMITWHNDDTYTTSGRFCRRRQNKRQSDWVKQLDLNFPAETLSNIARSFFATGFHAEGTDVARYALQNNFKNPILEQTLQEFDMSHGGSLGGIEFHAGGCPDYLSLIENLENDNGQVSS